MLTLLSWVFINPIDVVSHSQDGRVSCGGAVRYCYGSVSVHHVGRWAALHPSLDSRQSRSSSAEVATSPRPTPLSTLVLSLAWTVQCRIRKGEVYMTCICHHKLQGLKVRCECVNCYCRTFSGKSGWFAFLVTRRDRDCKFSITFTSKICWNQSHSLSPSSFYFVLA